MGYRKTGNLEQDLYIIKHLMKSVYCLVLQIKLPVKRGSGIKKNAAGVATADR